MNSLTLTYSLADQNFNRTKSVGIFNVATGLLENLAVCSRVSTLSLFSNSTLNGKLILPGEVDIEYHDEAIANNLKRVLWDQWGVYAAAKRRANQWLFLPKGFASFVKRPSFKLAVYIYDAVHNFYQVNYPKVMPWLENKYFTQSLKKTLEYADVIFTDSNFARDELQNLARSFKLKPPSIITAGIGFNAAKDKRAQKRDTLLFLTSVWPHKLTRRGVDFLSRWQKESGFSGRVELVGSLPVGLSLPQFANWRYHSRLSETAYRQFLAESKLLLFFSAYEGFGMPPVEAMIAGACPVFSDLPVTREVMGGRGFSFLNGSYASFADAMNQAMGVSEAQINLWSIELLCLHNWNKVIENTVNGLMEINNNEHAKA